MSAARIPWGRPDARAAVLDVAGCMAADAWARGFDAGAAHADERFWEGVEFQRRYEDHARGIAEWLTSSPPYDVLADRRGQPDRAETQRRTLAERGVWPIGGAA